MSRVGKKIITIPEGVTITTEANIVKVVGKLGELTVILPQVLKITLEGSNATITRSNDVKTAKSLHGALQRILTNAVKGVSEGWSKRLELVGTGYRAKMEGTTLVLSVGHSHPIKFEGKDGISFAVEENTILVSGINRHMVGQIAANIRFTREPDPYKGKGVKYSGERIRRKAGKAAKAGPAA